MADKIGYCSPPKKTRFKKGQTGNPNGRPKKSKNFSTLLNAELDQLVTINEDGKKRKVSKLEAMVKRIVSGALQGERRALLTMIELLKRTDKFDERDIQDILPSNYEDILDHYVQRRIAEINTAQVPKKERKQP